MSSPPKKLDAHAKDLFAAALEKPAEERAAFLASACGDDARLRAELATLLRGFDAAEQRFEEQQAVVGEQAGDRIGHYKLLQRIGEGGFGVVWMAEQEEPVRRKVALKVLKTGMDTAQVVGRFEAERQALALMDHQNIAKVFDGGATATGRPYFVMELVKGVPITQFCDDAGLDMAQRLELFVPVCQAVQHAHQKGVIHRDLKPSNVLVTLHDGAPVPKVIDFGIAKATAGSLTQRTVFTEFRQMLGTPEYMAPEQAELSSLDVDTRADIYSLGVLLYELLTGTRPFDLKTLLQVGYAEMLRYIKEVDPPKPSTRISTLGEAVTDIARHRRVTPRAFSASMRGDLDWIVMKALEKERSRRYDTATALAEDVLRHLRDEPVLASPPSRLYRWRKYAQRHRVGFAATAAIAVSLLVGAIVSTMAYLEADVQREAAVQAKTEETKQKDAALEAQREANEQRRLAEQGQEQAQREATKAKTITELLTSMLASSDPHRSKDKDYRVRQVLDDFDRSLGAQLADEPEIEAEVRSVMSDAYLGLGLPERAEKHAQRSLELYRGLHGEQSIGVVQALFDLVSIRHQQLRIDEALALLDQATAALPPAEPLSGRGRITLLGWRSDLLRHRGDLPGSETAAREGLQLAREYGDEARRVADMCFDQLGLVLSEQGKFAEAETHLRDQVAAARARWGEHSPHVATALRYLARCHEAAGRLVDAEATFREAVSILEGTWGPVHREVADCLRELADLKNRQRQNGEAEALRRRVLSILRASEGDTSRPVAETLRGLAFLLVERNEFAEAAQCCEQALAAYEHVTASDGERVYCLWLLATAQLGQGMEERALATLQRASEAQQALPQEGNGWAIGPMQVFAGALVAAGRYDEGEELARRVIRLFGDEPPREQVPSVLLRAQSARGIALQHLGRLAEAEELQRRHIEDVGAFYGDGTVDIASSMHNLACTLRAQQRYQEAEQWHEESVAIHRELGVTGDGLATLLWEYGQTAALNGELQKAEQLYDEARSLWVRAKGESSRDVAMCLTALGGIHRQREEFAVAEELQRRALAMLVQVQGPEHLDVADAQIRLAQLIVLTDRHAEARELLAAALATQEARLGAENP